MLKRFAATFDPMVSIFRGESIESDSETHQDSSKEMYDSSRDGARDAEDSEEEFMECSSI